MANIRVQSADFDIGAETAALIAGRTNIGGIASFIGTVRDTAKARPITSMTLEHYPGMTETAMQRIADQARQRFDLLGITLIHRIGTLAPGANIVLVLAASPHRQAALVSFHNARRDPKTEARPGPGRLRREERLEDPVAHFARHAGSGVGHAEYDTLCAGVISSVARRNHEPSAARHRVARIDGQVEQHLLELSPICLDLPRPSRALKC